MRAALLLAALWAPVAWADDAADLRQAELAIAARSYDEAVRIVLPILDDPAKAEWHGVAWARLGDLWADHEFPAAAVQAWAKAAEKGALGPSLGRAVDTAIEIGDEHALEPYLTTLPADTPEPARTKGAILGAKELIRQGKYAEAIALIGTVDAAHPDYARAQDLRGIAFANQGMYAEALAALLVAQAALPEKAPLEERAIVTHNVGRAYYGAGNYLKAIEHLGSVPRESLRWQDAQAERAWAHFAIGDHVGTLSVLTIFESPWFADWYAPEQDLLRLQAYFLLCKLVSATGEVDRFVAKYQPIKDALDKAVPDLTDRQAYVEATAWMDGRETTLPPSILHRLRWEERFQDARALVDLVDAEAVRAEKASEPWIGRAAPLLRARREQVMTAEGARVLARAKAAQEELAELLADMPILELDLKAYETALYERAAATGTLEYGDRIGRLRDLRKTRASRPWPVDGEVWADELGYVRYDVRSDCPEPPR